MDSQQQDNNSEKLHDIEGVSFNEDKGWKAIKIYSDPTPPRIITFVVKHSLGIIKNETQAYYFLLVFSLIAFLLSLYLFFGTDTRKAVLPSDVEKSLQENKILRSQI